jgi:hypothetical protein
VTWKFSGAFPQQKERQNALSSIDSKTIAGNFLIFFVAIEEYNIFAILRKMEGK